jgi:rhodanese-related sulfurtransferase
MARKSVKKQQNQTTLMLIGFGALILIIAAVFALSQPTAPEAGVALPLEISVQEAFSYREEGAFVLDVRTPEEWEEGHIPGATLIPLDQLENRLAEVPTDEEIVVICRSGNRSAVARDILLGAGFESVTSVAGGFNQWTANNFPVEIGP